MLDAALLDRQIALEAAAQQRGAERFNAAYDRAREKGRGDETEAGVYLIKKFVAPVSAAITAYVTDAFEGKGGRKQTAAVLIDDLDHDMVAFIALNAVLGSVAVMRNRRLSTMSRAIAGAIETELRMAAFEEQKPGLYHVIMSRQRERGATDVHVSRVMNYAAGKYGVDWAGWSVEEKLRLGGVLVHLIVETTGLAQIDTERSADRAIPTVTPTAETVKWITDRNAKLALLRPALMPMVVPPRPWASVVGGGYRSDHILKTTMIKRSNNAHRAALADRDLTTVLVALNAVQDTAWRINRQVYDVANELWTRGLDLPGLGPADALPEVPKPHDIETNEEAREQYRSEARQVFEFNAANRSKRLRAASIMAAAQAAVDDPAIYFPQQLDFRGRMYSRVEALSPQGSDLGKGLLTFAKGKPLGTERAAGWLAIHVANTFGFDKAPHPARIAWTFEHEAAILECASDPIVNRWWHEADAPWCFLAACFEWAGFCRGGLDHVSSVPIAMDGSCNGLQHYSAMLRDPIGGAATNLIPHDKPQDIYGRVAEATVAALRPIADDPDHPEAWMAQTWISFGLDRKMTKRQVMTLPYGSTAASCREYTFQAAFEKVQGGAVNPFGDRKGLFKAAVWLSKIIWESIGTVVVAAREAMAWLKKVAGITTKAGIPLIWSTPSGFLAHQAYFETKLRRVKTRLGKRLVYFAAYDDLPTLNRAEQVGGIAPNFVHSMDAAALALTVEMAARNGLTEFAMIHDSYGTNAADTDVLAQCLRETFVDMYTDHDVLNEFRDEIVAQLPADVATTVPPVPARGTLELDGVLESEFFFT